MPDQGESQRVHAVRLGAPAKIRSSFDLQTRPLSSSAAKPVMEQGLRPTSPRDRKGCVSNWLAIRQNNRGTRKVEIVVGEFGRDHSSGGDSTDFLCTFLSEPQIAIRPQRDRGNATIGGGDRKLGDCSCRGDSPDVVPIGLCKPQISGRPCGDPEWQTAACSPRVLGDHAGCGDCPDVATFFCEPQVAIRAPRDPSRAAAGDWKLRDDPCRAGIPLYTRYRTGTKHRSGQLGSFSR